MIMMKRVRGIILFLLVLTMVLPGNALTPPREHSKWIKLSTDELLDMAKRDIANGGSKDTALMCYTIISNRYEQSMAAKQKGQCMEATMRLWSIYFYDFYDYPKCFDCLTRAREISNDTGLEDANIYLGFGCMYQTLSEECNNYELGTTALEYYCHALEVALRTHNEEHIDMASTNMVAMAHVQGGLTQIESIWRQYLQLPDDNETWILRRYNKLLYQAFHSVEQNQYSQAIDIHRQQLALIDTTRYSRLIYFTHVEIAKVYAMQSNYREAINALKKSEKIAVDLEMKDCKLEVYGMLSQYFERMGDHSTHEYYYNQYNLLKDTLTNYQQLTAVSKMEFRNELKDMEEEMTEIKHHREVMSVVILISLAFLLLLLVMLYLVYKKNGQLMRSNKLLYQKNVEMLRADEEERRMRRQLHDKGMSAPEPVLSEDNPVEDKVTRNALEGEGDENGDDAVVKYKSSHLTDDNKQKLLEHILEVMDNDPEIFSPDFSLERLALLSGSKYKYVSQVINEFYQQNFNNFLNSYRIKEACKRMGDLKNYGNYTIEAISESVGFKSRSTFVSSFKRITGLTPSQYQRMAKKEAEQ